MLPQERASSRHAENDRGCAVMYIEQTVTVIETYTNNANCDVTDLTASSVRCGRMWRSACTWKLQELTMLDTCRSMVSAWSSSTLKSLTLSEN